jgi:hypothetical protein
MDQLLGTEEEMTKDRPIPNSEAFLDVKAAVEKVMAPPQEDLLGILS